MIADVVSILLLIAGWLLLFLCIAQRNSPYPLTPCSRTAKRNTFLSLAGSAILIIAASAFLCVYLSRFLPALDGHNYPDYIGGYALLAQIFISGFTILGIIAICFLAFLCFELVWTLILAVLCGYCLINKNIVPTGFRILFLVLLILNTFIVILSLVV